MEPEKKSSKTHTTSTKATSPWTEAYQTAPAWSEQPSQTMPEHDANNSETQAPTQNALSDIYNRGY